MATASGDAPPGAAHAFAAPQSVTIAGANLYLDCELCAACFPAATAVALIVRDDLLHVVPLVSDSAGGLLLKIRNRRGDRVVHAQEFFRDKGFVEDPAERRVAARWSPEAAALVLDGVRRIDEPPSEARK